MNTETTCEPTRWKNLLYAVGVVLMVLGWRVAVYAKAEGNRKLAKELVSITEIVNHPVPNHGGTQLLFAETTEEGVGISLMDLGTARKQRIFELPEERLISKSLALLAWSPDDRFCAYASPIAGKRQKILLCNARDGTTNTSSTTVGYIEEFCWLAPNSFAYLNNSNQVRVISRVENGRRIKRKMFKNPSGLPISCLAAISPTTLAWQQDGAIWSWSLSTNAAVELWRPKTNELTSCYYSADNGKFIINARNKDHSYQLSSLEPRSRTFEVLNRVELPNVSWVRWINSGKGYAFLGTDHWGDSLFICADGKSPLTPIFPEGDVKEFREAGSRLFLFGSEGIEPPGIWDYDLRTHQTRPIVRPFQTSTDFAKAIHHSSATLTNEGRQITYQVWRPTRLQPGKKYPLILTQTPYDWSPYPVAAAASGYYFVKVNRESWFGGIENWESDVLAAYKELIKDTHVDVSRVFLFGHSAETPHLSDLATEQPSLWKGIIVLSPTGLPELSNARFSGMWIDTGERDPTIERNWLVKYQAQAAARGIDVRLLTHPNARHTSWATVTDQAKLEEMLAFLARY